MSRCTVPQRAFTLLELLIAVVISGILASIALPTFQKWRGRSFRTEAKTNLSAFYKFEKAYYFEHETYADDLTLVGWQPTGSPRYVYGFTTDAQPVPSGLNDTAELCGLGSCDYSTTQMVDAFGGPLTAADLPPAGVSSSGFTLAAAGNLDNDASLDVWRINDVGIWSHINDDL